MKRSEYFAMLLQAVGVWEILEGLESLPLLVGWFLSRESSVYPGLLAADHPLWVSSLSLFGLKVVAGLLLFFVAPWFARKVYRDSEPTAP
jgi:hypothetical protein